MDYTTPRNSSERRLYWLAIAKNHPPEWLAAYIETTDSCWAVVTENGPAIQRQRNTAYLQRWQESPYWAFALAKSYLDDVGEWPLAGIQTELALAGFEERLEQGEEESSANIEQAVREILASVQQVWPELEMVFIGEEQR